MVYNAEELVGLVDIPCVNCGACCKKVPCVHGKWNEDKTACAYLVKGEENENFTTYFCGEYDRIILFPDAWFTPAFGAGCCRSLFNEDRERIVRSYLLHGKPD